MRRLLPFAVLLATACGSGSNPSAPSVLPAPAAPAAVSAPLPATLVGRWAITITAAEQASAEAALGRSLAGNAGLWQLGFAADGSYSLNQFEEGFLESGIASVSGDVLSLRVTDFRAGSTCHGNFPVGSTQSYRYAADATTLVLRLVQSGCPDDVLVLSTRPLQRID